MATKRSRRATVDDVHDLALAMPHVKVVAGTQDRPIYQVGSKSFVFFRNPRPDAVDPATGERYDDVIVLWVADEGDKLALVQDETTPFFTTPHFDGHPSVLLRASRIGELAHDELAEVVQDAWLAQASPTRRRRWLEERRRTIEEAVLGLLDQRRPGATICPSDAARLVGSGAQGDAWRSLMEPVREVVRELAARGVVEITQGGKVVDDPAGARGPIRIRRARPGSSGEG